MDFVHRLALTILYSIVSIVVVTSIMSFFLVEPAAYNRYLFFIILLFFRICVRVLLFLFVAETAHGVKVYLEAIVVPASILLVALALLRQYLTQANRELLCPAI